MNTQTTSIMSQEIIDAAKSEASNLFDTFLNSDDETIIKHLCNEFIASENLVFSTNHQLVLQKVKVGIYARILKERTERNKNSKWEDVKSAIATSINRSLTTLDSCILLTKYGDIFNFSCFGPTKLIKLIKILDKFMELLKNVSRRYKLNSNNISEILQYYDQTTENNLPSQIAVCEKILLQPSILYHYALSLSAKGTSFEEKLSDNTVPMTFRQAKELLDELKLRDLDAEKINKLINDLHTENQISSLPTTIEAEFDKFKSSFRSILEGAGNTQENISNAMSKLDKFFRFINEQRATLQDNEQKEIPEESQNNQEQ